MKFYTFINRPKILLSILLGFLISWFVNGILTSLLFPWIGSEGPNFFYQFIIICAYTLFFSIPSFLFISLLERLFPRLTFRVQQKFDRWNDSLIADSKKRIILALVVLSIGFLSVFIVNNVLSHINTNNWQYENPEIIPVVIPIGQDFRGGLYWPAENLIKNGRSLGLRGTYPYVYPPLVTVISLPYLLFNDQTAYLIHVGLLILANIICLALASFMVKDIILCKLGLEQRFAEFIAMFIFFVMAIFTFSSYGFAFSVERGNVDIFAMFFAMLAMWILLKKPDEIWLQVILLSIAVHFKIYPAALFAVLFYKHGKKLILPALIVNVVFLFILGPTLALSFIQFIASEKGAGIGNPWQWIGNHSAYSFAEGIIGYHSQLTNRFFLLLWIFMLLPTILWAIAFIKLIKEKYQAQNAVFLIMVTIPLMDLVPTISNDYKLVILSTAAILLIAIIIKQIIQKQRWGNYFQLLIVFVILLFLGRPYVMSDLNPFWLKETASFFINNKYLWSLALEGLIVWNIFRNSHADQAESSCSENTVTT